MIESFRRAPFEATIRYEERPPIRRRLTGLLINNTRHVANFLAFPRASCCDGFFDVMELDAGWRRQNLHNLSAASRLQFYTPAVPAPLSSVEIALAAPQDLMIDGEIYPDVRSLAVRILPGALHCYKAVRTG